MTATGSPIVFRFESPGLAVEFEGPTEFVEAHMERLRSRVQHELRMALRRRERGGASAPGDAAAGRASPATADVALSEAPSEPAEAAAVSAPATPPTLGDFYRRARSREGRGALQETILIFAHYLSHVQGQREFSVRRLARCFDDVDATPPSNLANTMGLMKRAQGLFAAGEGRGLYVLTDKGTAYVRRLVGAQ